MKALLSTLIILLTMSASHAEPSHICPVAPGFIPGPYVPNQSVARQIFKTIAAGLVPAATLRQYKITVDEQADNWVVYQSPRQDDETFGGGGLAMRIDKCSGAVSEVYYQR